MVDSEKDLVQDLYNETDNKSNVVVGEEFKIIKIGDCVSWDIWQYFHFIVKFTPHKNGFIYLIDHKLRY